MVRVRRVAFLFLILLLSGKALAEKRVALVIGNSRYSLAPLSNPTNDADDLSGALGRLGFNVTNRKDLTVSAFDRALDEFVETAQGADVALFFFSGHGVQIDKRGYLAPIDVKAESESSALRELVSIQEVISRIENAAKISVIVLDACRDSPLQERLRRVAREQTKGIAPVKGLPPVSVVGSNTLIVYATVPGETASDGVGRNSPFISALLRSIETPGLEVEAMFKRVTADVLRDTGGKQQPERLSRLQSDLVLLESPHGAGTSASPELEALRRRLAALEAAADKAAQPIDSQAAGGKYEPSAVPRAPERDKPASSSNKPADIWYKLCVNASDCETRVDVRDNATAVKIGGLRLREASGRYTLSATLPLQSALPPGALIKIDSDEPIKLSYDRCYSDGCYAEARVSESTVNKMRSAKQIAFLGIDTTGRALSIPLPLDDFSKVFDGPPVPASKYKADLKKIDEVIKERSGGKIGGDKVERQLEMWKPSDFKIRSITKGSWYKLCIDVPTPEPAKAGEQPKPQKPEEMKKTNVCLTQLDIRDRESSVLASKIAIREIAGQDKPQLLVMVPLGVGIQPGVNSTIGGDLRKLAFTTCDQFGCYAEAAIERSYVSTLKSGGRMSFTATDEAGAPLVFNESFEGFGRAFDGPPVPVEKYNEDQRKIAEVIRERLNAVQKRGR
jgi:uncharacterized caspase-like protein